MEIIVLRKQYKLLRFESIELKCSYLKILCILFTNLAFEAQLHVTKLKMCLNLTNLHRLEYNEFVFIFNI